MKPHFFLILIFLSFTFGCVSLDDTIITTDPSVQIIELNTTEDLPEDQPTEQQLNTSPSSNETLRIGAFNVQVFGVTKAGKPEVMATLADIIRTYDIIAIQEIRDSSQTALPKLVDLVNSDGSQYQYVVSERLGRTTKIYNIALSRCCFLQVWNQIIVEI
jgi:hypothetical protein